MSNKIIEVTLDMMEVALAAKVGENRYLQSRSKELSDKRALIQDTKWDVDIEGAAGELAFAKAINRYWRGSVNRFKDDDVDGADVRTVGKESHCLIVRPEDRNDIPFVLVMGRTPTFKIMGYIMGEDAKQDKWLRDYNERGQPAYFVPQSELRPIATMQRWSHAW